jgi:dolichol kinase
LGGLSAVLLALDLVRLRSESLNRLFFTVFRHFASPREGSGIASSTWFVAGAALAIAILPRPYAAAGILVLALADPIANWFGRLYGQRRFGGGTILGSTLFWVVSFGLLLPVSGVIPALIAASTTTVLEAARWRLDDNLIIPVAAGGVLWLIAGVLGVASP